jgi:O-antigen ligase
MDVSDPKLVPDARAGDAAGWRHAGSVPSWSAVGPRGARAAPGEWVQTILLVANLAWTTLCLGGYRPETMVVTSGLTAALLIVHAAAELGRRGPTQPVPRLHPAGWLLLPFLAYAAANVILVSPVPWLGWRDWYLWAQMTAVFWVVLNGVRSRGPRRTIFLALVGLGLTGVALGCYQAFLRPDWLMLGRVQSEQFGTRASGSFGIPNSFAGYLLLLLPAAGVLACRRGATATARVWWMWVTSVLVIGFALTISRGAWLALGLAVVMFPLWVRRWRWRRRVTAAVVALGAVLVVGIVAGTAAPQVRERFEQVVEHSGEKTRRIVWRAAWRLFQEAPVWGTGAGSYNVLFEKHRPEGFPDEPQWAHNEFLNTLSDYGAVGFLLFFGACGLVVVRCRRGPREPGCATPDWLDDPATTAGLAAGLLAFGLHLGVDFHFKIPALGMAFAAVAAMVVGRAWPAGDEAPRGTAVRVGRVGAGLAAALGIGVVFVPAFRAEALRYNARESLEALARAPAGADGMPLRIAQARAQLEAAVALHAGNAQAWADLAYATALWARVETGRDAGWGRQAESAAGRALQRSAVCPEFWIRRGVARNMQGRWLEAGDDFVHAVALAPNHAVTWYYYAEHLSRRPGERALAEAALAFCLRLDPWNSAAVALRHRLANSSAPP